MKTIRVSNLRDEVITFLDRKASELSDIAGRKITRNEYIALVLEKQLRDDLALDDRLDLINEKLDLLTEVIHDDKEVTNRLIGLIVHGDDVNEEVTQ